MVRIGMGRTPRKSLSHYDQVDLDDGGEEGTKSDKDDMTTESDTKLPFSSQKDNGGAGNYQEETNSHSKTDVAQHLAQNDDNDHCNDKDEDSVQTELVSNLKKAKVYDNGDSASNVGASAERKYPPRRKPSAPTPPALMFQKMGNRRFPSYKRPMGRRPRNRHRQETEQNLNSQSGRTRKNKDKKGRHQVLATEEYESYNGYNNGSSDDEDEPTLYERDTNIAPNLIKSKGPNRGAIDPTQFPLEQYSTDAEYGETSAYPTRDPMSRDYAAVSLRKMGPIADQRESGEKRRKIKCFAGVTGVIGLWVLLIVLIARSEKGHIDIVVEPPPGDLENMCDIENISTKFGHRVCKNACKAAKCCMKAGKESCFLNNEEMCGRYSPCGTLHSDVDSDSNVDIDDMYVAPPPNDLGRLCSDASIVTSSGFLACQSACHIGRCCFHPMFEHAVTSSNTKSCWESHSELCDNYAPCLALQGIDDAHGSPIDLVNEKCTANNIRYAEGRDDCENACQARSCCFAESRKSNCLADNVVYCNEFKACKILVEAPPITVSTSHGNTKDDETSFDVNKCLDVANLTTEDFSVCSDLCAPAACCFYDDLTCSGVDCSKFNFCDTVAVWKPSSSDAGDENQSGNEGGSSVEDGGSGHFIADEICSITNLMEPGGIQQCQAICSDYMCCFSGACVKDKCLDYQACGILVDDDVFEFSDSSLELNVAKLCSVDHLLTAGGRTTCQALCEPHGCCFSGECDDNSLCSKYEVCNNLLLEVGSELDDLVKDSDVNGSPPANFATICASNLITASALPNESQCYQICKEAECCRNASCPERRRFCKSFSPCNAVWQVHDGLTIGPHLEIKDENLGIGSNINPFPNSSPSDSKPSDVNESKDNDQIPQFIDLGQDAHSSNGNAQQSQASSTVDKSNIIEPTDSANEESDIPPHFTDLGSGNIQQPRPANGVTTPSSDEDAMVCPPPLVDFETLCSEESKQTVQGMQDCMNNCAEWMKCCWPEDDNVQCNNCDNHCRKATHYCPVE